MVEVENTPPYDVLMKINETTEEKELEEKEDFDEECPEDEALRIALEAEEDEELLDVESPDIDEMDASETSSSAVESSPQAVASVSPGNVASIMMTADTPQTSTSSEVMVLGTVLGVPSSANHVEKRHICDICGKGFPYHSILESHKRCHTGEKPFNCHFCDKKFAQKATLQVHERTHTGERPYKCRYCEKTFAQYGTKTVHEKSAHLGIRNYKCPKCDKCLSSPSALYTHKKTHGEKTFQCEFCPKTFTLKNYLKLHVKQVHEQNERKHVCRFCGKSFAYAGSLQVHVRTHTGERPYRCSYCPKAFASQGNLQSHERTHTGERPYTCGTCGRSFIQKSQLTAHEATHATMLSECQFCDKSFTNQGNMQVHQRVHTGEKPYSCNACGKSYAQKVGLKIHLEQCEAYRVGRTSESPVNVDTDSDSSDSSRKIDFSLPNIYANTSPPSSNASVGSLSSYTQWSVPDILSKLPTSPYGFQPTTTISTPPAAVPFRAPEPPPPDFGPLTASKPPFHPEVTMPEAFSAFYPPSYTSKPVEPVIDPGLAALKGLVDSGLSSQLLPIPNLLSQQLLNTQLLIQQLQNNEALLSMLSQNVTALQPPPAPAPPAPLAQAPPAPLPPSLLDSFFPAGLLPGLPIPGQTALPFKVEVKSESMY
ncbi:zinc finger, C2H2 type [Ancylostoma ceylanicum]|uniref:Zinc finger, C2H2 type n=1 Tax=Ancylostoma ceylanicum TaxID=53326 RepID=A0A0D6LE24_9BILA|nr:zinc finger, C2H2 type [Ancylostoma ceylanicum]